MPTNVKNKPIFLVVVATKKLWLSKLKCKMGIVYSILGDND